MLSASFPVTYLHGKRSCDASPINHLSSSSSYVLCEQRHKNRSPPLTTRSDCRQRRRGMQQRRQKGEASSVFAKLSTMPLRWQLLVVTSAAAARATTNVRICTSAYTGAYLMHLNYASRHFTVGGEGNYDDANQNATNSSNTNNNNNPSNASSTNTTYSSTGVTMQSLYWPSLNVSLATAIGAPLDEKNSAIATVRAYIQQDGDGRCDLFIGPRFSDAAIAQSPLMEHPMWVDPGSSNTLLSSKVAYPAFLRTIPSDAQTAPSAAYMLRHFKWSHVHVLKGDSTYAASWAQSFTAAHIKLGGTVVHSRDVERTAITEEQLTAVMLEVRAMKAQSRVIVGVSVPYNLMSVVIRKLSLDDEFVFIYSEDACSEPGRYRWDAVKGAFCVAPGYNRTFYQEYYEKYIHRDAAYDVVEASDELLAMGYNSTGIAALRDSMGIYMTFSVDAMWYGLAVLQRYQSEHGGALPPSSAAAAAYAISSNVSVAGLTGEVSVDGNGDRRYFSSTLYNSGPTTAVAESTTDVGSAASDGTVQFVSPVYILGKSYHLNGLGSNAIALLIPDDGSPRIVAASTDGSSLTATILGVVIVLCTFVLLCIAGVTVWWFAYYSKRRGGHGSRYAPKDPHQPVAVIFTDIQSSTALWAECPLEMSAALDLHNKVIRECIAEHDGYEVKTIGDSFMIAFCSPSDAVGCAVKIQDALFAADWLSIMDDDYEEDDDADEEGDQEGDLLMLHRRGGCGNSASINNNGDLDHYYDDAVSRAKMSSSSEGGGGGAHTLTTAGAMATAGGGGLLRSSLWGGMLGGHTRRQIVDPITAFYNRTLLGLAGAGMMITQQQQQQKEDDASACSIGGLQNVRNPMMACAAAPLQLSPPASNHLAGGDGGAHAISVAADGFPSTCSTNNRSVPFAAGSSSSRGGAARVSIDDPLHAFDNGNNPCDTAAMGAMMMGGSSMQKNNAHEQQQQGDGTIINSGGGDVRATAALVRIDSSSSSSRSSGMLQNESIAGEDDEVAAPDETLNTAAGRVEGASLGVGTGRPSHHHSSGDKAVNMSSTIAYTAAHPHNTIVVAAAAAAATRGSINSNNIVLPPLRHPNNSSTHLPLPPPPPPPPLAAPDYPQQQQVAATAHHHDENEQSQQMSFAGTNTLNLFNMSSHNNNGHHQHQQLPSSSRSGGGRTLHPSAAFYKGLRVRIGGAYGVCSIRATVRDPITGATRVVSGGEGEENGTAMGMGMEASGTPRATTLTNLNRKAMSASVAQHNNNKHQSGNNNNGTLLEDRLAGIDPDTVSYDYFGPVVNLAARIEAAGHGGQVLVSKALWEAAVVVRNGIGAAATTGDASKVAAMITVPTPSALSPPSPPAAKRKSALLASTNAAVTAASTATTNANAAGSSPHAKMSAYTAKLCATITNISLGKVELRGISEPVELIQLTIPSVAGRVFPPLKLEAGGGGHVAGNDGGGKGGLGGGDDDTTKTTSNDAPSSSGGYGYGGSRRGAAIGYHHHSHSHHRHHHNTSSGNNSLTGSTGGGGGGGGLLLGGVGGGAALLFGGGGFGIPNTRLDRQYAVDMHLVQQVCARRHLREGDVRVAYFMIDALLSVVPHKEARAMLGTMVQRWRVDVKKESECLTPAERAVTAHYHQHHHPAMMGGAGAGTPNGSANGSGLLPLPPHHGSSMGPAEQRTSHPIIPNTTVVNSKQQQGTVAITDGLRKVLLASRIAQIGITRMERAPPINMTMMPTGGAAAGPHNYGGNVIHSHSQPPLQPTASATMVATPKSAGSRIE